MPWEKSLNSGLYRLLLGTYSCGYEGDMSTGCCLVTHIWSSSHTYIVKNVHDDNLCLYTFIMLVVDPLIPENAFFPLQFQNTFTYAILIFCIQFTLFYLLFTQRKTQKYYFYNTHIFQNVIQHYFFSIQFKSYQTSGILLPVGLILLFRNQLQTICALAVIRTQRVSLRHRE